ncbi:MAG: glutathione S-transferase [Leptolyngbyaceae cyanobacterium T60_A2020_046]|nr:glutathione S-transferase [Leptolyngbyaceae cyanobacterium T60_A2020_046]
MAPGFALPPPEDPPEEVLRTEIITDARSPLTGEPLTAAEYAALQEQLQTRDDHLLPSDLRELVFLLQLRRVLQLVVPLPF